MNVAPLQIKPDEELIEICERMLAMAKSGEMRSIGVAYVTHNQSEGEIANWEAAHAKNTHRTMTIGALFCLIDEITVRIRNRV